MHALFLTVWGCSFDIASPIFFPIFRNLTLTPTLNFLLPSIIFHIILSFLRLNVFTAYFLHEEVMSVRLYGKIKVAYDGLGSSIYDFHMEGESRGGKSWQACIFSMITWKIKCQINIYIVSWTIWIFKTKTTTTLILLYTMK